MDPPISASTPALQPPRVVHFVTGGFSGGATQVAIALCRAARETGDITPLLVLRRKPHTDPKRIQELRDEGLQVEVVPSWPRWLAVWQLVGICKQFKPDVLVAHGFSEHLWGRYAGLLAKVPHMVHVEHNARERYTRWRLKQSFWLAKRTDKIIGISEDVRSRLIEMGFDPQQTIAIPNGINLQPFAKAEQHPLPQRQPNIVMVARFAPQKDHATLLRAVALLRDQHQLTPTVYFAGGGKQAHRKKIEQLVDELQLQQQVKFLGVHRNVPDLLLNNQISVLSTHYEGIGLALLEAMAAGCAVIGSNVVGAREAIEHGVDGYLVPEADPQAMADTLKKLLDSPSHATQLGQAARTTAIAKYNRELMHQRYQQLFLQLAASPSLRSK